MYDQEFQFVEIYPDYYNLTLSRDFDSTFKFLDHDQTKYNKNIDLKIKQNDNVI